MTKIYLGSSRYLVTLSNGKQLDLSEEELNEIGANCPDIEKFKNIISNLKHEVEYKEIELQEIKNKLEDYENGNTSL